MPNPSQRGIVHLSVLLLVVIIGGAFYLLFQQTSFLQILGAKNQGQGKGKPATTGSQDLDVTYINRTPRYYRYCVEYPSPGYIPELCSGTEDNKRWPNVGEEVTYTAHIINKGDSKISGKINYEWLVDGSVVNSGTYRRPIQPGQEATVEYKTAWPASPQNIQFKIDSVNSIVETIETNNSLVVGSHDLTISIWVEKGLYDIFNQTLNLADSYSFEDWIQAQFKQMNERFLQAEYPASQNGIKDRIKIDKVVVADDLDGGGSPMNSDPDLYLIDGRWQFRDNDPTNAAGEAGKWQEYVDNFATKIDWGLIHELAHQLGVIDIYRMNLKNDPATNNGVEVKDGSGNIIPVSKLPTASWCQQLFPSPGIMGGGDTTPYNDQTYFESHTSGGMNSHFNFRRGYFGDYLFDIPINNSLGILDSSGNPISDAQVFLYQKDGDIEVIDDTPEITGTTDLQGTISLPNKPVTVVSTATGHSLKDNPFGQVNVTGTNGTMLVRVVKAGEEGYGFLLLHDLNLAYWEGNKDSAVHTVKTNYPVSSFTTNECPQ